MSHSEDGPRVPVLIDFAELIPRLFALSEANREGEKATYIPQLAHVNEELFGVSFCSVDGNFVNCGDFEVDFCLQSTSKVCQFFGLAVGHPPGQPMDLACACACAYMHLLRRWSWGRSGWGRGGFRLL